MSTLALAAALLVGAGVLAGLVGATRKDVLDAISA